MSRYVNGCRWPTVGDELRDPDLWLDVLLACLGEYHVDVPAYQRLAAWRHLPADTVRDLLGEAANEDWTDPVGSVECGIAHLAISSLKVALYEAKGIGQSEPAALAGKF